MANLSTARKLSLLARIAAERAGQTRTLGAVWRAGRATVAHVGHVLHQLWLEVTGFIFLALAGVGAGALVREYTQFRAGKIASGRLIVAACFTALFAWFGVSSFWRARRRP
jgi:hypothetical protein